MNSAFTIKIFSLIVMIPMLFAAEEKHLFILSGQSNMAGMDPKISFIPAVEAAFGKDKVRVVKSAKGGQPIRRWYKNWKSEKGEVSDSNGDLYDVLIKRVKDQSKGEEYATVTFVWMQGERDAKERHGNVYGASFKGLLAQLAKDLGRTKVYFVIGRISDFDMNNKRYGHWTVVRDAQVKLAEEDELGEWVNTDDLNDGKSRSGKVLKNDLHYTKEGYKLLGERFAAKAISLIEKKAK